MIPSARLRLPDSTLREVRPGALIGRLASAQVCLADPSVSEAHALVSLRGGRLHLVALRGAIGVGGRRVEEVQLVAGLRVRLAEGVELEVEDLALPERVPALVGLGPTPVPLVADEVSVVGGALRPGVVAGALVLWQAGGSWCVREGEGTRTLAPGDELAPGLRFVEVPLAEVGAAPTRQRGRVYPPMRVRVDYESTRITGDGARDVVFTGRVADLFYQLVDFRVPTEWDLLAKAIWKGEADGARRRWNFDKAVKEAREELTRAGFRAALVDSKGGRYWLHLLEGDSLEDLTAG